jgi:hypothetical protein
VSFFVGAVVGAVIGVVVTVVLQPPFELWYAKARATAQRLTRRAAPGHGTDLQRIGLYQVVAWAPSRPLDPGLHDVQFDPSERVQQRWFPEPAWREARQGARSRVDGVVADVSGYSVDHGEAGVRSNRFTLSVRRSSYADAVAMQSLTNSGEHWPAVEEYLRRVGTRTALATGPPQSLFVNLTVTSADLQVLALRRSSAAVVTSGGLWSLGACETMAPPPTLPGDTPETLFDLARRAAMEELGLTAADIGPIWFSWLGFSRCDGLLAVAHTRTQLASTEAEERILGSHGTYESDGIRWFDVRSKQLDALTEQRVHDDWLGFTCIVARDLKRLWKILDVQPRRH